MLVLVGYKRNGDYCEQIVECDDVEQLRADLTRREAPYFSLFPLRAHRDVGVLVEIMKHGKYEG